MSLINPGVMLDKIWNSSVTELVFLFWYLQVTHFPQKDSFKGKNFNLQVCSDHSIYPDVIVQNLKQSHTSFLLYQCHTSNDFISCKRTFLLIYQCKIGILIIIIDNFSNSTHQMILIFIYMPLIDTWLRWSIKIAY